MTTSGTPSPESADRIQAQADSVLDEMAANESDDLVEPDVVAHGAEDTKLMWSISYRT